MILLAVLNYTSYFTIETGAPTPVDKMESWQISEAVLDIIFRRQQTRRGGSQSSAFNATSSLGRCRVSASIHLEAGNDRPGSTYRIF